jgi:hypothetical protein
MRAFRSMPTRFPRLTAALLGVAALVAGEVLLRLAGAGDLRERPDPFGGFSEVRPTFRRVVGADGRAMWEASESPAASRRFAVDKPPNGFRVFVFGGSSEVGTPYGYDYGFPAFLQTVLAAALPDRAVEVVNCAVPGYASRRLLYVAREVAAYAPDLFVVSTGHNELVEQRLFAHLVRLPPTLFTVLQRLRHLRTFVLVEDAVRAVGRAASPEIPVGKIYVPDFGPIATRYWATDARDAARQRYYALAMFRTNLDAIVQAGRDAGARVMLLTQPKNYVDWPVTGGRERPEGDRAARRVWKRHMSMARKRYRAGDLSGAANELEAARAVDPRHGATVWRLAEVRRAMHDARAAALYRDAHDLSGDDFGTTSERNATVREVAARRGALFLDMERIFAEASPNGLVGFNLFVDFLHPNLAGQELIAESVAAAIRDARLPDPAVAWRPWPPLPAPEVLLARVPNLRVLELKIRVVAEVISARPDRARAALATLRALAPDDPQLGSLDEWTQGKLPFAQLGEVTVPAVW